MYNDLTDSERTLPLGMVKEDILLSGFGHLWGLGRERQKEPCAGLVDMEVTELFQASLFVFSLLRQRLFVSSPCTPNWLVLDLQGILLLMAPISSKNTGITDELKFIPF